MTTRSLMAEILDLLGTTKVPEGLKSITLDWAGPLGKVKEHRRADLFACPCEFLVADDRLDMEVQHHDGLFGDLRGPAGTAFATALANQSHGYNNMQAVVAPNLAPPIRTMMVTKVRTDSLSRVVQLWGAAQSGIGKAVTDAYDNGWFPEGSEATHVLVLGVFIHPFAGLKNPGEGGKWDPKAFLGEAEMANSMHGLYWLNYLCTLGLLADAITGGLTPAERIERAKTAAHPFLGFKPAV